MLKMDSSDEHALIDGRVEFSVLHLTFQEVNGETSDRSLGVTMLVKKAGRKVGDLFFRFSSIGLHGQHVVRIKGVMQLTHVVCLTIKYYREPQQL